MKSAIIGKRFSRKVNDDKFMVVEVLSETRTHVYVKVCGFNDGPSHRENITKQYFMNHYSEVISYDKVVPKTI